MSQQSLRHGDVCLRHIPESEALKLIKEFKKAASKATTHVVQHGESGHKHVITAERPEAIEVWSLDLKDPQGVQLYYVKAPAKITHEEHHELPVAPGYYLKKIEEAYDPFEQMSRAVYD
jgi:hypothetical protein